MSNLSLDRRSFLSGLGASALATIAGPLAAQTPVPGEIIETKKPKKIKPPKEDELHKKLAPEQTVAAEFNDNLLDTDGRMRSIDSTTQNQIQAIQPTVPSFQETLNHVSSCGVDLNGLSFNPATLRTQVTGTRQCFVITGNPRVGNAIARTNSLGGLMQALNLYSNSFTVVDYNSDRKADFTHWSVKPGPHNIMPHMSMVRSNRENQLAAVLLCSMKNLVESVAITEKGEFIIRAQPDRKAALEKTIEVLGHSNPIVTTPGQIGIVWIAAGEEKEQPGFLGTLGRGGGSFTFRWSPNKFRQP